MRAGGAIVASLLLAGCAGGRPIAAAPVAAPIDGCDAGKAALFVGRRMKPDLAESARAASGARAVRIIPPGTMVTMDYRPDRLNVRVDEKGAVTAIRCG